MYKITKSEIRWCDGLVKRTIRIHGRSASSDEIQIGRLAMCEAAIRYDPDQNDVLWQIELGFLEFAKKAVRGAILREISGECYINDVYNTYRNKHLMRLGTDFNLFSWPDVSYDYWPKQGYDYAFEGDGDEGNCGE